MKFLAAPLVLSLVLSGLLQSAKRLPVEELMPAAEDTVAADTLTHSYTSISAIGDLMCHSTQYKYVATGDGHYDFTPCFSAIAPVLKMADLCVGNLETTLAGRSRPYSGYPQFNTPDDYVVYLKEAGIDFLVTANNHSNDTGEKGIRRTLQVIDSVGFYHTGTFGSEEERNAPQLLELNGIKVCILAYTYGTNGFELPAGKPWLVNQIDSALIRQDVRQARAQGAEVIITFMHWGTEYSRKPDSYQEKVATWCVDAGADIILGSHPHVLQPAGRYITRNAAVDTGFIAWSMGNFISNQRDRYTYEGIAWHIGIEKELATGKIRIADLSYTPTWVYRGTLTDHQVHIVYSARDTLPEWMPAGMWKELDNSALHTAALMENLNGIIFEP